jgi:hypothetical protein
MTTDGHFCIDIAMVDQQITPTSGTGAAAQLSSSFPSPFCYNVYSVVRGITGMPPAYLQPLVGTG